MANKDPNGRFVTHENGSQFWYHREERTDATVDWDDAQTVQTSDRYDMADLPGCPPDIDWTSVFGQIARYGGRKIQEDRTSGAAPSKKIAERNANWREVFLAGEMKRKVERGPRVPTDLRDAVAEHYGITAAQAEASLRQHTEEQWATMRKNEDIARILEAASDSAPVDLSDLTS